MTDGRNKNNLTAAQRRKTAKATIAKRKAKPKARKASKLERAKAVLRRSGREVFAAKIDMGTRGGDRICVDTRLLPPSAVIELAEQIIEREYLRNTELRAQHGLPTAKREKL